MDENFGEDFLEPAQNLFTAKTQGKDVDSKGMRKRHFSDIPSSVGQDTKKSETENWIINHPSGVLHY